MNNVNTQLDLLIEVLNKKIQLLQRILEFSKEQAKVLSADDMNLDAFNGSMQNKQACIDKVVEMDNGFQTTYENIRTFLDSQPELYKEKIQVMKDAIIEIGELGIAIKVQESRNKSQFDLRAHTEKNRVKDIKQNKKTVANYYANVNKQKNIEQSHFFDSKK